MGPRCTSVVSQSNGKRGQQGSKQSRQGRHSSCSRQSGGERSDAQKRPEGVQQDSRRLGAAAVNCCQRQSRKGAAGRERCCSSLLTRGASLRSMESCCRGSLLIRGRVLAGQLGVVLLAGLLAGCVWGRRPVCCNHHLRGPAEATMAAFSSSGGGSGNGNSSGGGSSSSGCPAPCSSGQSARRCASNAACACQTAAGQARGHRDWSGAASGTWHLGATARANKMTGGRPTAPVRRCRLSWLANRTLLLRDTTAGKPQQPFVGQPRHKALS